METIEDNNDVRTPVCLDPISCVMPCQPGIVPCQPGECVPGGYPLSRWDHMPALEACTPPLFTEAPVDPRSLEVQILLTISVQVGFMLGSSFPYQVWCTSTAFEICLWRGYIGRPGWLWI